MGCPACPLLAGFIALVVRRFDSFFRIVVVFLSRFVVVVARRVDSFSIVIICLRQLAVVARRIDSFLSFVVVILSQLVVVVTRRVEASFCVKVDSGVDRRIFARSRVHAHVILVGFHPQIPSARKRVSQILDFGYCAWTTSIGVIACFLGRRSFDLFAAVG